MDLGWTHPSARKLAQAIPGPHSERLARAARRHEIYVVAGLVERAGDKLYNSAILLNPDGQIRLLHRKINELEIAHDLYSIGDRLGVAETGLGVIGLDICADNFSNSLAIGHVLARMGAQLILAPSAWAVKPEFDPQLTPYGGIWRESFGELTRLYDVTVVAVSNVGPITEGPWTGRSTIGCSLAMGPGGEILAEGPYGVDAEALIVIDVDLRPPIAKGTQIAEELAARGYEGP
jgi:predicted amidohydrolase